MGRALLLGLPLLTLSAQTPSPAPAGPIVKPEEELIILSPFVVSTERETGYAPVNSLSGSRAGLKVAETPYSISVLTRDLLDDLGVTDLQGAVGLFGGVSTQEETQGANAFNDYNINVRNLGTSNGTTGSTTPPTRNYFEVHFNFDSYNMERIELARGPNSFFNSNQSFGSVNSSTKVAVFRPITEFALRTSSLGGGRATLDVNRKLNDKVALRINTLWDDQNGWRDYERTFKKGVHLAMTYKPWKNGEMRVEYEYGNTDRWVPFSVIDAASLWDGTTTTTAPLTAFTAGSTGLTRLTTDTWTYNPAVSGSTFYNWRNFLQSTGTGRQLVGANRAEEDTALLPNPQLYDGTRLYVPADKFTWVAPNMPASNPVRNVAIFGVQQLGPELALELAGSWFQQKRIVKQAGNLLQNQLIDVNRNLPTGEINPYFGQAYTDARIEDQYQSNDYYNGRAQLAYSPRWDWLKARVLAGVEYNWSNFRQRTWVYVNDVGTGSLSGTTGAHVLRVRRYLSQRDADFIYPESGSGLSVRPALTNGPNNDSQGFSYNYRLAFTGAWLRSGKLKTIGAIRFDERYQQEYDTFSTDSRGEYNVPIVNKRPRNDKYSTSYNGGLTYTVLPDVNVYASYGMNTPNPNNAFDISGKTLVGGKREGIEGGVKFSLLSERVGVTMNYFLNKRANEATTELSNSTSTGSDFDAVISNIWTLIGTPQVIASTFSDVRSYESKGWELETTANLNKNLSVRLNFSVSDSAVEDEFALTRAYLDSNRGAWTTGANALNATDKATVLDSIAALDAAVASVGPGRSLRNAYDYTGSAQVTYRFIDGALKGFQATLGGVFRGDRTVNQYPRGFILPDGRAAGPYDFYMADAYATYSLNLAYRTKLWGTNARFQAGIDNLLDDQVFIPSSANTNSLSRVDAVTGRVSATGTVVVPNRFSYVNPRRISISSSFSF